MARANIFGVMEVFMWVTFETVLNMVKVNGENSKMWRIVISTRESTWMIGKMAMESLLGKVVITIKANM